MYKQLLLVILFAAFSISNTFAQLTAKEAVVEMGRGINMGNTLDATNYEGGWALEAKEYYFDMYKDAGFKTVRIPITWSANLSSVNSSPRISTTAPYTIDPLFFDRLDTIIKWSLERDLYTIINVHHDGWVKVTSTFDQNKPRLFALWEQVADHYKDYSDKLMFEILNEPHSENSSGAETSITTAQVNEVNSECLDIIRLNNPTRIVIYGGPKWSNSVDLFAAAVPDASDEYLMAYYHSYDPWPFAGEAKGTWGTTSDVNTMISQMAEVEAWSNTNNIPVLIGEFGAMADCEYNSRMKYYAHYTEQALAHGMAFTVWDDNGWFQVLDRADSSWNDAKDILIHTSPQSPTDIIAEMVKAEDTLIHISWTNRALDFDTLYLEKRENDNEFITLAKLPADSSSFNDTVFEVKNFYYYRVRARYNDSVDLYSYPTRIFVTPMERAPFKGEPFAVPGTIEAEDFDIGGEGLSYHDLTTENQGDSDYRLGEFVDIEARQNEGGLQVGYADAGEWLEYTIDVAESGEYEIVAHIASMDGGGKLGFSFPSGNSSDITAPKTSSWEVTDEASVIVNLEAGEQIMRVNIKAIPNYNLDKFVIQQPSGISGSNLQVGQLFPNPTAGTLYLKNTDFAQDTQVEIISISGVMVQGATINDLENGLDISGLAKGVYFIRIQTDISAENIRFLKK